MKEEINIIDSELLILEEPQIYLFDEDQNNDSKLDPKDCINKNKIRVFEAFAGYGGASFNSKK